MVISIFAIWWPGSPWWKTLYAEGRHEQQQGRFTLTDLLATTLYNLICCCDVGWWTAGISMIPIQRLPHNMGLYIPELNQVRDFVSRWLGWSRMGSSTCASAHRLICSAWTDISPLHSWIASIDQLFESLNRAGPLHLHPSIANRSLIGDERRMRIEDWVHHLEL